MGQSYSKEKSSSNYGSIYLQTDAPYYLTGTMVTGKIYMNIYEAFPAAFLDIQIKGKEKTKWYDHEQRRKDDGQYESIRVKRKGDKGIIYTRVPLYTFPDRIVMPGQYCYPFSFPIPNGIPGSVLISNHQYKAQIKYSLTALLEPWKDHHIKKMKYKQRLIIREPAIAQYGDMFDDSANVTSCCCFSKGMSKVRASFQKNFYTPLEVARCSAWIDNTACSVNVSRINLQLRLQIDLRDDHGRHRHFDKVVCSRSYPGIGKNEKTGDDEARFLELNLQQYKYELKQRKKKAWGQQDLAFGSTIPPNSCGSRAKVWYTLEVAPAYDDLICCTTQPRVELPMYIMPDQLPFFGQIQQPQNWNPQQYEVNNFVLDAGAQQPPKGTLPSYYQQLHY